MKMLLEDLSIGTIYEFIDVAFEEKEYLNENTIILKHRDKKIVISTAGLPEGKFKVLKPILENGRRPLID